MGYMIIGFTIIGVIEDNSASAVYSTICNTTSRGGYSTATGVRYGAIHSAAT